MQIDIPLPPSRPPLLPPCQPPCLPASLIIKVRKKKKKITLDSGSLRLGSVVCCGVGAPPPPAVFSCRVPRAHFGLIVAHQGWTRQCIEDA